MDATDNNNNNNNHRHDVLLRQRLNLIQQKQQEVLAARQRADQKRENITTFKNKITQINSLVTELNQLAAQQRTNILKTEKGLKQDKKKEEDLEIELRVLQRGITTFPESNETTSLIFLLSNNGQAIDFVTDHLEPKDFGNLCKTCRSLRECLSSQPDNEIYEFYATRKYPPNVCNATKYYNGSWRDLLNDDNDRNMVYIEFERWPNVETIQTNINEPFVVATIVDFYNNNNGNHRKILVLKGCEREYYVDNQLTGMIAQKVVNKIKKLAPKNYRSHRLFIDEKVYYLSDDTTNHESFVEANLALGINDSDIYDKEHCRKDCIILSRDDLYHRTNHPPYNHDPWFRQRRLDELDNHVEEE